MTSARDYLKEARQLLTVIEEEETETIQVVADRMSDSMIDGGIAHVFGSGHSAIGAKEVFIRAGTLSSIRAIGLEHELDKFERLEGVAETILGDYELLPGEVLIVISNSGINPLPVEMAMAGNSRELHTVAVTSLKHSRTAPSRHSSGKKLFEVADIVLDTHVPSGDAALEVPDLPVPIGPLSTLAVVSIMDAIVVETITDMLDKGHTPPVRMSRNLPGGDEHNQRFREQYGDRIPEL